MPDVPQRIVFGPYDDPNILDTLRSDIDKIVRDRFAHCDLDTRLILGANSSYLEVLLPPNCPVVLIKLIAEKYNLSYQQQDA